MTCALIAVGIVTFLILGALYLLWVCEAIFPGPRGN